MRLECSESPSPLLNYLACIHPWPCWGMFLSAVRRTASPSTPVKRLISVRVNLCYDLVNQPLDFINSSFPICLRSRYYMAHRKPRKLANTTFSNTLNWLEGGNIFMILKVCLPLLALGGFLFRSLTRYTAHRVRPDKRDEYKKAAWVCQLLCMSSSIHICMFVANVITREFWRTQGWALNSLAIGKP